MYVEVTTLERYRNTAPGCLSPDSELSRWRTTSQEWCVSRTNAWRICSRIYGYHPRWSSLWPPSRRSISCFWRRCFLWGAHRRCLQPQARLDQHLWCFKATSTWATSEAPREKNGKEAVLLGWMVYIFFRRTIICLKSKMVLAFHTGVLLQ